MPMPFFSVVIPVYNRTDIILPTLHSVRNQTFKNFECIVVDDGSRDADRLRELVQSLGDDRFKYIYQKNAGGSKARNTGIMAARGSYIAFLDSDDQFLPSKLEHFHRAIESAPDYVYYSKAVVDRGVGKTWIRPRRAICENEDVGEYLFCSNEVISTITIVVRTDVAKRVLFDPELPKMQDPDFCLRLQWAGHKFKMIDIPLSLWNDSQYAGRTSKKKTDALSLWFQKSSSNLTAKARCGFKASVLAPELNYGAPFSALKFILEGFLFGGASAKGTLRQIMRTFLPNQFYRFVVNTIVKYKGDSQNALISDEVKATPPT
jgi:glycosyltransferase involved in cell wall biosynthesis